MSEIKFLRPMDAIARRQQNTVESYLKDIIRLRRAIHLALAVRGSYSNELLEATNDLVAPLVKALRECEITQV